MCQANAVVSSIGCTRSNIGCTNGWSIVKMTKQFINVDQLRDVHSGVSLTHGNKEISSRLWHWLSLPAIRNASPRAGCTLEKQPLLSAHHV